MAYCEKLLEAEDAFVKLNEELELETKKLFDQANHVMSTDHQSISDHLVDEIREKLLTELNADGENNLGGHEFNRKTLSAPKEKNRTGTTLPVPNIGGNIRGPRITRHKSEIRIREQFEPSILPESIKGMGQDSMLKFLKAKVQTLLDQIQISRKDEKKLIDKVKELEEEREKVSEDRDKWIQQANITKNLLAKQDQNVNSIIVQLQNLQAENGHLKRDIDKLKKELKQVTNTSGTKEVRLNRSMEEVEKLKNCVKQMKQDEKEIKEGFKRKHEEMSVAMKRLEKQKTELLHAFKKQMILIDNLKKQRGLLDSGKLLKAIEDDFMDFLDWNPH